MCPQQKSLPFEKLRAGPFCEDQNPHPSTSLGAGLLAKDARNGAPTVVVIPATVTNVTMSHRHLRGNVEAVTKPNQGGYIDWNAGREGYVEVSRKPDSKPAGNQHLLSIRAEERFGCMIAAGGTIWATYVATVDYASLWRMQIMPPGPMEVCALGILVWIHAKWRRSNRVD